MRLIVNVITILQTIDGATRFTKGMYIPGTFHCLSFHIRKVLAIAKGGMILTDDEVAAKAVHGQRRTTNACPKAATYPRCPHPADA